MNITIAAVAGIVISLVSLFVSATTLWFTLLRRGHLRMTKPTVVFFGYDFEPYPTPKVFLRTLLYSTAVRGKVIEGMYVKVRRARHEEIFSFWGYGETNKLVPGSGLFVGQTGLGANHHFVLSVNKQAYVFESGAYSIAVFARLVGQHSPMELCKIDIELEQKHADALSRHNGVMFELGPDDRGYIAHVREKPVSNAGNGL